MGPEEQYLAPLSPASGSQIPRKPEEAQKWRAKLTSAKNASK